MSVYATDDDAAPRQYSEEMFKLSPDLGSRHRIYLACALQPTTANDPTSPHRPHIDGVVRFSPPMSSSAPDDLENELLGRIEYDKIEIFGRLKLQLVDDNLVHQCRLAFDRDDRVAESKMELKTLVASANVLSLDKLEDQQCRSLLNNGEWELEMYPHLRALFDFITDFSPATCLRRLVETPGPLQDDDNSHTLESPKAVPDFSLLSEAPLQAKASEQPHLWSDTPLSPIYDMWEHTDVFIRVIRSLTSVVIDFDLGQDRTAPPRLELSVALWSWDLGVGAKMIMKTAWRQGYRSSESIIHRRIKGAHRGLAKPLVGADVEYRAAGKRPERMSVQYLRLGQNDVNDGSPHGWATTMGIRSELELLLGVRAALDAHEFLCDQGIVHRDISRSNILLRDTKYDPDSGPDGGEGFLTDLEFARIPDAVTVIEGVGESQRTPTRWREHGAPLTGNVQFMALDILRAGNGSIEHTACHDVESFIWVLGYCVLRKLVNTLKDKVPRRDPGRKAVEEAFHDAFGHNNVRSVLKSRVACLPLTWLAARKPQETLSSIKGNVSILMAILFNDLRFVLPIQEEADPHVEKVRRALGYPATTSPKPPLTHAILREMLDTTIKNIRTQAAQWPYSGLRTKRPAIVAKFDG
ncbi:predicted protein [Postia placenta Mad-698-R]|uniref:Fungal-type protein kinase domain-containing protein n=1 Tax=Postia placenta MAD-698-R-SB12 TaxID=670580 RepID=A0A1X6MXY5_9APHY|nr:hypothetical protein POSPLADRAFT_1047474 [Postia placenta MAD-698-R-SB12]EED80724.1 predicted protein [Postia placenta Mad-698-R]OSX61235.1 hypothetical protein POSPLADRAFT_1047474 [Postia placenta MAD-698-R-SB12]